MNERSIFIAALEKDDPAARAAYLDQACGGDFSLRQRIERLLRAHEKADSFLEPSAGLGPTVDTVSPAEGPGTRIGPYKLLQQIGEGGMGTVFMAEQEAPVRRLVAVKIIKPGMDSAQVLARFEAERQAFAMMDHPNIAKILDAGTTATNRPYFVMELVKGIPITRFCDENQLTPRERLALFIPVCHAVQHAHQKGVIHRDLKPSNVLVALYDDRPVSKVIDFGVAKAIGQRLTERTLFTGFGALVGTLEYMSPEQAKLNALDIDTRSDVYALGVLLYELLTGSTPLDRDRLREAALDELLRIIREEEPPTPSTRLTNSGAALAGLSAQRRTEPARLGKLLRGELDWIVMKALEKDRSRRYETANGLARDIERYLHDEAVEACPPSATYRLRKFTRKHRTLFLTAAALATVLLLGVALSAWQALRARQAEAEAIHARNAALGYLEETENERDKTRGANRQLMHVMNDQRRTLYAAHMNLAQSAFAAPGGVGRARELLDQHRPGPGEPDPRGFEWHYWNRQSHTELRTFTGHSRSVGHFALSHDGRRLAADARDGTIIVWDFATGKLLLHCRLAKGYFVLLGFRRDDRALIVERNEEKGGDIGALDAQTGKELWMHPADAEQILCHAFSPDSRHLASGGKEGTVKLWDLETGKEPVVLKGHPSWVNCVAFSPDGQRLASSAFNSNDRRWEGRVWDTRNGQQLFALPPPRSTPVRVQCRRMEFSPDGERLAACFDDGMARVWQLRPGFSQLTMNAGGHLLWSVGFADKGRLLVTFSTATADSHGHVRVWDARTGQQLHEFSGHAQPISCWEVSPDGQKLVTGSMDRAIKVWNVKSGQELLTHRGHRDEITDVKFTPDGSHILSSGTDGLVMLWDATKTREPYHSGPGFANAKLLAFAPDGNRLAISSVVDKKSWWSASNLSILDTQTDRVKLTLKQAMVVVDLAYSPDGRQLAAAAADQDVKIWDAQSGQELFTLKKDGAGAGTIGPGAVAYSSDARLIASVTALQRVKIWDARTGKAIRVLSGHTSWVNALAFRPGGSHLACTYGSTIKIWDAETGKEITTLEWPTAEDITCLAYSHDGQHLVAGSSAGVIRWWNAATGREERSLRGHTGEVTHMAFAPEGQRLASASTDGTVKLWDTAIGQEIMSLTGPGDFTSVAFDPAGRHLAAVCRGDLRVWDATPLPD